MQNCVNQIPFWKEVSIPPDAWACTGRQVSAVKPFSGIALSGKICLAQGHAPFLGAPHTNTEWYKESRCKGLVYSPQLGTTRQDHSSPTSRFAKSCSAPSLPQVVIPRAFPLKLRIFLHCNLYLRSASQKIWLATIWKIRKKSHIFLSEL